MTDIGKMIRDEGIEQGIKQGFKKGVERGIEQGIEQGKAKGKAELLIKQLMKKFKKLPDVYTNKIKTLSDETLETIAGDIFDINDVKELEKYF